MRVFFPEVRLRQLIRAPGGISVAIALERAEAEIETMRESSAELMAEKVRLIDGIASASAEGARDDVYRASNELLGEGGVFGWRELTEVARGLCELLDATDCDLCSPLVKLHIQTLKALVSPELAGDESARKAVLDGLRLIQQKAGQRESAGR